jgi:hypothetical protein
MSKTNVTVGLSAPSLSDSNFPEVAHSPLLNRKLYAVHRVFQCDWWINHIRLTIY